jgi:chaperone BCS1
MDELPPLPLSSGAGFATVAPQNAILDFFFPGFSVLSAAVEKYLHIDLNIYIPLVMLLGGLIFVWRYFSDYVWDIVQSYLMSVVDIRVDDEIYNMVMAWVSKQRFSQGARRFVVNTNLNSRSWYLWRYREDDDDDDDEEGANESGCQASWEKKKKRALAYTPTFGSHWFWYKGRLLMFRRTQNTQAAAFMTASEREEISISCFGRDPWVLKELLHEARQEYMKHDENKTIIYRGTTKSGSTEPVWQRCMARTSRPFSTVILNEKVKKDLIDDVTDYLDPATRRWYSNRGIPYRRGYLLYGPPGTGKSSISLALAGFFKMRIYIVSLSSVTSSEENLASLFSELPRRCVVLLEDIDTAGLTHTREDGNQVPNSDVAPNNTATPSKSRGQGNGNNNNNTNNNQPIGRLSLSGLLNILDGVASQEGRVLIMTTNHLEKLDKALIRPGRVDMIVKFDLADAEMTAAIFRAIYAPLEGDKVRAFPSPAATTSSPGTSRALFKSRAGLPTAEEEKAREAEAAEAVRRKEEAIAKVDILSKEFASKIPAREFSPAEIQGFLLKHKRNPEKAVEGAETWVADTRREKKKEQELKEAQAKREEEESMKKAQEEEGGGKKRKKKKGKKERRSKRKTSSTKSKSRKKDESGSEESSSGGESSSEAESSESESEREVAATKKRSRSAAAVAEEKTTSPASAPAAEAEPVVVVVHPPPTFTVDTDKANGASLDAQKNTTPREADSGYGTP